MPPRQSTRTRHLAFDAAWLVPVLAIAAFVGRAGLATAPPPSSLEGWRTAQLWQLVHDGVWPGSGAVLGWAQLGAWTWATDAFGRHELAVTAAREGALVAALVSAALVYLLVRSAGAARWAGAVGALVVGCAPAALLLHRQVDLAVVAAPWVLAAFLLAGTGVRPLVTHPLAGVAIAVAVLGDASTAIALPFVAWRLVTSTTGEQRRTTVSLAAIAAGFVVGLVLAVRLLLGAGGDLGTALGFGGSGMAVASVATVDPVTLVLGVLGTLGVLGGFAAPTMRPLVAAGAAVLVVATLPVGASQSLLVGSIAPMAVAIAVCTDAAVHRVRSGKRRHLTRDTPAVLATAWIGIGALAVAAAVPTWGFGLSRYVGAATVSPVQDATDWLDRYAARSDTLLVDESLWADLVARGWDPARVSGATAAATDDWRDTTWLVATPSVRGAAATSLGIAGALGNSVPVAVFGSGDAEVQIRRIAPDGIASAERAAVEQTATRMRVGAELAANPNLTVPDADRDVLRAGLVDLRIMLALTAQLGAGPVAVAGFPEVDGEAGQPRRQVAFAEFSGSPAVEAEQPSDAVRNFLWGLTGEYAPQGATVDGDLVVVTFPVGEPAGLIL